MVLAVFALSAYFHAACCLTVLEAKVFALLFITFSGPVVVDNGTDAEMIQFLSKFIQPVLGEAASSSQFPTFFFCSAHAHFCWENVRRVQPATPLGMPSTKKTHLHRAKRQRHEYISERLIADEITLLCSRKGIYTIHVCSRCHFVPLEAQIRLKNMSLCPLDTFSNVSICPPTQ